MLKGRSAGERRRVAKHFHDCVLGRLVVEQLRALDERAHMLEIDGAVARENCELK